MYPRVMRRQFDHPASCQPSDGTSPLARPLSSLQIRRTVDGPRTVAAQRYVFFLVYKPVDARFPHEAQESSFPCSVRLTSDTMARAWNSDGATRAASSLIPNVPCLVFYSVLLRLPKHLERAATVLQPEQNRAEYDRIRLRTQMPKTAQISAIS